MGKRKRRTFTPEQRAEAVKIVVDSGKPVAVVARELGLTVSALAAWVKQASIDATPSRSNGLTSAEKVEIARLKSENKRLAQENAFLKKASAFFAKESL